MVRGNGVLIAMAEAAPPANGGSDLPGEVWVTGGLKEIGKAAAYGASKSGWIDDLINKFVLSHVTGGSKILKGFASVLDDLIAVYVGFIGELQGKDTPGFFTLLSTVLGDLLGVDIDASAVTSAWKKGGEMAGFKKVGGALWNTLVTELGSPATLTPESGLASAQGFMGYLLGFSVREGNLNLLSSFIPEEWRFLEGIDQYPKAMRSALGFGRMARQALHPLIQTLIADPLQWYVNREYMPKLLGEGAAIRAYNRGWISREALDLELQYAGYSADRAATLLTDAVSYLSPTDAWENYTHGNGDISALNIALRLTGFDPNSNDAWIQARTFQAVQPYVDQLIADWKGQWLSGYITLQQLEAYLDSVPMLPDAKNALKQAWGQLGEYPRRKLTLAEVQSAFVEGLLDSTDVSDFLKREGYSDDDQLTLWYQTLLKLGTQQAKMAVAQYTYDKAKAKAEKAGEPIPPPPAILAETSGIPGLPNL